MSCIDNLIEKLDRIAATASKNEKLAIVKTFSREELSVVRDALDPTENFYIAKLPEITPDHAGTESWDEVAPENLLYDLANRNITGNEARNAVADTLARLKADHAKLLRKVVLKDLRAGFGDSTVNKAFPGSIPVKPYMRCTLPKDSNLPKWTEADWEVGVISQIKADGMYATLTTCPAGGVQISSRQGSVFPADAMPDLHTFDDQMTGLELQGELLVEKDGEMLPRQVGNGMLNSLLQGGSLEPGHKVVYQVWDCIPQECAVDGGKCNIPYSVRLGSLDVLLGGNPGITMIETKVVHSYSEALAHYKDALRRGLEGTILKHPNMVWKDARSSGSKDVVKLKLEVVVSLKVLDFVPGTGKNADTFGSLRCGSDCGRLLVDVSGFTDKVRADFHSQGSDVFGSVIDVKANAVLEPGPNNELHSLFLPRFVEQRLDKSAADSLDRIVAEFEGAVA